MGGVANMHKVLAKTIIKTEAKKDAKAVETTAKK
jgi:hypothetical protein